MLDGRVSAGTPSRSERPYGRPRNSSWVLLALRLARTDRVVRSPSHANGQAGTHAIDMADPYQLDLHLRKAYEAASAWFRTDWRQARGGLSESRLFGVQPHSHTETTRQLTRLVYELLDAHEDTARLAAHLVTDLSWQTHLTYLRDLQRIGREKLAQCSVSTEK